MKIGDTDRTAALKRFLLTLSVLPALVSPALAQLVPNEISVVARACAGNKGQLIDQTAIAEALLIEDGRVPFRFLLSAEADGYTGTVSSEKSFQSEMYSIFSEIRSAANADSGDGIHPLDADERMADAIRAIEVLLNDKSKVQFDGINPGGLFLSSNQTQKVKCLDGKAVKPFLEVLEQASPPKIIAIREKPEELWLGGKEGRKAGSFKVGLNRTKTIQDDGTKKRELNVSIDGTVGLRITKPDSSNGHTFAFGKYNLNRDRVVPKPQLAAGKTEADSDTDVLEVGLVSKIQADLPKLAMDLFIQSSAIFDFANNSERIKVKGILQPGFVSDFGICNFGSLKPLTISNGLRTRCSVQLEAEGAGITKRGKSKFQTFDTFFALGGTATFEAFLPTSDGNDDGVLASAKYRFLPVVHGPFDNIERLELELKHRFWSEVGFGIDIGASFIKGTNELSFDEEDILTLGAGVIF